MSEIINEINEYKFDGSEISSWGTEEGFQIVTSEQEITLAINADQSCCESWGYFLTEDDTDKYIGRELLGVTITDTNRSSKNFVTGWGGEYNEEDEHLDEGEVLFVDIETDIGILQFVAYNAHNGYYGHEATVRSKQIEYSVSL
jgi:hypothetical protein